jgi:hypothetical protein
MATEKYTIELDTYAEEWEYTDAREEMEVAFEKVGDYLYIEGTGMGWTRASGYIVVSSDKAVDALGLNGEYRIVLNVGETLSAVRYSHDEPTGASFTFRSATDAEVEDSRY